MNTKTMEGLVGAGMNMKIRDTPMRVYKEAEREGNIGKMEQAMGYVNELGTRAWECKSQAEEGMAEEAEEMKENEKLEKEEAAAERREEKREQKEEAENTVDTDRDTLEVSEEGRKLLRENKDLPVSDPVPAGACSRPVIYTKEGRAVPVQPDFPAKFYF